MNIKTDQYYENVVKPQVDNEIQTQVSAKVGDYVEEKARCGECFEVARKAANKNLNDAIVVIIEQTIAYLKKNNKPVYQLTEETYQFYLKEVKKSV